MAVFSETIMLLIDAKTSGAVQPLNQLETSAKKADTAFDKLAKNVGLSSSTLKAGLVAGATALVGTGLVKFLQDSVEAYGDAAKAAGDLANATGGSVDEVSRLTAALEDAGVSAEQTAVLLTKFTSSLSTTAGKKALQELNVELVKNKDGTIDYAASMVKVVDAIGEIDDAAKRSELLKGLFGQRAVKLFNDLYASGIKLSEAMQLIQKYRVFTAEDVRRAAEYDDAMDSLHASVQGLQFTLGKMLVPAISLGAETLAKLLGVMAEVPPEIYLVVAAAYALNKVLMSTLVQGAFVAVVKGLASIREAMIFYESSLATMTALTIISMESLTAAMLANPVGVVLAAVAAAVGVFMHISGDLDDRAQEIAASFDDLTESGMSATDAIKQLTGEMESQQNILEGWVAGFRKNTGKNLLLELFAPTAAINSLHLFWDAIHDGGDDADFYAEQLQKIVDEQGAMAGVTADATAKQTGLNDAVAEYLNTTAPTAEMMQNLTTAAIDANTATDEQKRVTELATIAQGQYATSIQGTVEWYGRLAGLTPTIEEALNNVQVAAQKAQDTQDNPQTWGDEALIESGKAQQAVWDYVGALAASGLTDDEIIAQLVEIKTAPGASDELKADVDTAIGAIEGKTNEIPVNLKAVLDPESAAQAQTDAATAVSGAEAKVNLQVGNVSEVKGQIHAGLTGEDVTVKMAVGNIPETKSKIHSGLTDEKVTVQLAVGNLAQVKSQIHSYLTSEPVTIRVQADVSRAKSSIASLTKTSAMGGYLSPVPGPTAALTAAPVAITNNYSVNVSGAGAPEVTAHAIDRYFRRAGDRSRVSVVAP